MKQLFITSFTQVFLVSMNTVFLSRGYIIGIALMCFLISWVWVGNVKKATIATRSERFIYSTGAMCGGISGYYFTMLWI